MAVRSRISAFARYLPVEPDARAWGLHVIDCGFTEIPPQTPYPPGRHPKNYMFQWDRGRVLSEYQLIYITRGEGVFESRSAGHRRIRAGDIFLLFPGEWHRYRPSPRTGWDESWIGFDGDYAKRIMSRFFFPADPVLRVGFDETLLAVIRSIAEQIQMAPSACRQIVAARTVEALALILRLAAEKRPVDRQLASKVDRARCVILGHSNDTISLGELARNLGMSYSSFRSVFKRHTGSSPRQYQIQIRINKARSLLTETDLPIARIAEQIGFSSAYYFSRLFKRRTGQSPRRFRDGHHRSLRQKGKT